MQILSAWMSRAILKEFDCTDVHRLTVADSRIELRTVPSSRNISFRFVQLFHHTLDVHKLRVWLHTGDSR